MQRAVVSSNNSSSRMAKGVLLGLALTALLVPSVRAATHGMTAEMMNNPNMTGSHNADASFYDYIVVGSGPGGATVARYLSNDPKNKVLLLEAGENRDNDKPITTSSDAWIVPTEFVPEYFWQMMMMHNEFKYTSHDFPDVPVRRRLEEAYRKEVEEAKKRAEVEEEIMTHRFGGGPPATEDDQPVGGRRSMAERIHRRLHGYTGEMKMEQYMGGRLMGGSSSINGEQVVWPTARLLRSIQAAVGGDPAWSPENVYNTLREMETFVGASSQPRGGSGPLDVKEAPANPLASGAGVTFVQAMRTYFDLNNPGMVPTVEDYNDPANPTSVFSQWQLSQQPNGARESSSTAMLPLAVKERKNLVIKTRATVMYIKFKKNVAQGIYYTHAGIGQTAYARKEIIISAGHRSSILLENSGVGNKMILEPILSRVGFPMVADVPGVGENLGNDGFVMVTMTRPPPAQAALDPNPNNLYHGGAFTPYPNANANPNNPMQSTLRFGQLIGVDNLVKVDNAFTFSIGAISLNTTALGWAHIQSADPLYAPLVTAKTLTEPEDRGNWWYLMREQVAGIIRNMQATTAGAFYQIIDPAARAAILDPLPPHDNPNYNPFKKAFFTWLFANYVPSHHWYGTCKMGTNPRMGAVTDSGGRVYGVKRLRVADASIYPIKLDGNTQIPAYIAGAIIAKKILAEN